MLCNHDEMLILLLYLQHDIIICLLQRTISYTGI